MKSIQATISFFILILCAVSILGWRWTAVHQTSAQSMASHLVLGMTLIVGAVGMIAIWRAQRR